jgi:hypothetical protein
MNETTKTRSPAGEDAKLEAAVMQQLLALHPAQLSFAELAREISGGSTDFAATDPVDRAVHRLGAAGLVNRNGDMVLPSRAALRLYELLE